MRTVIGILFLVCGLCLPLGVGAESARSLVATGNERYAAGEYDQALEAYEQALAEQPRAGEVLFNKGNVYFQKGEYDKAREAYRAAALDTKDLSIEAAAHYNLGNTVFAEGQKELQTDPRKALTQYGESIRYYQEALRIDPGLQEAAQNIEMVRLTMKDLADRIKKAEEAAKDRQKQQEAIKKDLEEAIKEQESEIKDNQDLQRRQAENPNESQDGQVERLASDQEQTRRKTTEVAEKLKEMAPQPQAGQQPQAQPQAQSQTQAQPQSQSQPGTDAPSAQEHLQKAQEAQKDALEKLSRRDLDEAGKDQETALDKMRQALARSEADKNRQCQLPKQSTGDQDQQDQEEKSGDQSQQQAASPDESAEDPQKSRAGADQQQPGADQQRSEQARSEPGQKEDGAKADEQMAKGVFSESPENVLREEKENRRQLYLAPKGGYKAVDKDW